MGGGSFASALSAAARARTASRLALAERARSSANAAAGVSTAASAADGDCGARIGRALENLDGWARSWYTSVT